MSLMPNETRYITPAKWSERWHWHRESIRRKLRQEPDTFPSVRIGRRLLVELAAVERYEAAHRVRPPARMETEART